MSTHEIREPDPGRATAEELLVHAAWLRRLARSLVADSATADDLVQDTWIAAMRKPPRADQPLGPWLARVVRNLAHGRRRGDARRAQRESARIAERHELGPDETAGSLEMQRLLLDLIEALDEPQRSTLVRHYFHGKTSFEIGREDGVADGTVRWRLKQAVDELKVRLDARHDGDRRSWAVMLAPFSLRADPPIPAAAPATGAFAGGVIMSAWIKAVAAALLVSSGAVGAWLAFRTENAPEPPALSTTESGAETLDELEPAPAAGDDGARATVDAAPGTASSTAPAVATPASDGAGAIEASVIDSRGAVVAGAKLSCVDKVSTGELDASSVPFATSDARGRVRLALAKSDLSARRGRNVLDASDAVNVAVQVSAPGKAMHATTVGIRPGTTTSLGEVVLADGGDVAGRVVGADGAPVTDVRMRLVLPDMTLDERAESARAGLYSKPAKAECKTAADGSFSFPAVPVGLYRAWSDKTGWLSFVSEPFEVRAAQRTVLPEVVLLDNPRAIHGRVIGIDGKPSRSAELQYLRVRADGKRTWISDNAAADGTFVVEWFDGPTVDICATGQPPRSNAREGAGADPKSEADRGQALERDIPAGKRDLVLQLQPTPPMLVTVRARDGGAVDRVGIGVYDEGGNGSMGFAVGGERTVRLRATPSTVVVRSPGFIKQTFGPFEPGRAPDRLDVLLDREVGVTGRVTADGAPVERMWIRARRVLPPDDPWTCNGFPSRLNPRDDVLGIPGPDGSFSLSLEKDGRWVIMVLVPGWAAWESEPLELGPTKGKEGLKVELLKGGTVEGRVAGSESGSSPARYATLSRGAQADVSALIAADGTFRAEHLTPGEWMIRLTAVDYTSTVRPEHRPCAMQDIRTVKVADGATTNVEIDANSYRAPTLDGRLSVQSVDVRGWTASLAPAAAAAERWTSEPVDEHGAFRIVSPEPGPHRLRLSSPSTPERAETIEDQVELGQGTRSWALDVGTGSVRVPASVPDQLTLSWSSSSTAKWSAQVRKASGAELVIEHVPAGMVRVEAAGRVAAEVVVRAGEVTVVDWR